jgi:uncharacterized protein YndB with AHSA1/START domain
LIRVEASRVIERPIADVWAYLSNLDNMPAWDPGLIEVEWHPPLALGAAIEMRDESPIFRLASRLVRLPTFAISELEDGRRIGLRATPDGGKSWLEAVYSLERLGPRQTTLTRVATIHGAGVWRLLEVVMRRRARREREAEVANLKRILESDRSARATDRA